MTTKLTLPPAKIKVRLKETASGGHIYEVEKNEVQKLELPGVTTPLGIIGGGKTNALMAWAAKLTSLEIVEKVKDKILATKAQKRATVTLPWIEDIAKEAKSAHRRAKDDAADLGTRVHEYADAIVRGITPPKVTEDMAPAVEAFEKWYKDTHLTFVAGDTAVANPALGYAGAVDAFAFDEENQHWVLVDFKTSNGIREEYALQVAAYAEAAYFTYGISVGAAYVVRFDKKKAKTEIKQVKDLPASLDAYVHALNLHNAMKKKHYA